MRLSKRIKRWGVYRLASFCSWLLNCTSRKTAQAIGKKLGHLLYTVLPKERAKIVLHLGQTFGDQLSLTEKQAISRQFFINSGKNLADFVRFKKHFQEMVPLVTIEGIEHYRSAFDAGRGVIGVTGHIGHFELLAARLALEPFPVAVIAREMYDPRLDRMLVSTREAVGLTVVPTTASPRFLLEWLKKNGAIGVLIDTDSIRVRGDFVDWFGRPAYTPIGQTLLGLKTGAAFVPMACVRKPDDTYHIIIKQQVNVVSTGDTQADARRITQACVRELEKIITDNKDQWIWLHNRWNTRPPAQKSP